VKYHGANCFSLSSLAEQGNAHDKNENFIDSFHVFHKVFDRYAQKIDLKG
jgi:hypothetical protein